MGSLNINIMYKQINKFTYMYNVYMYIYIYMLAPPPMYLLILVCFIEHIAIYATTLMGRGTMYDKYLLWFKAEIHPLRFFLFYNFQNMNTADT